jgi:hypothetical protein
MNPKLSDGVLRSPIVWSPHDASSLKLCFLVWDTGGGQFGSCEDRDSVTFVTNYGNDSRTAKYAGPAEQFCDEKCAAMRLCVSLWTILCYSGPSQPNEPVT